MIWPMPAAPATDRVVTLPDGQEVVAARRRAFIGAWFLDGLLVWAVTLGLAVPAGSSAGAGTAVVLALLLWPVVSFVYGLTTAHRRSIGQRAAGTRTLRKADGSVPGPGRAGWVMLVRLVILPLASGFYLLSLVSGDALDTPDERHLSIDVRATEALRRAAPMSGDRP